MCVCFKMCNDEKGVVEKGEDKCFRAYGLRLLIKEIKTFHTGLIREED